MNNQDEFSTVECYRKVAVELSKVVWDLMDRKDRTPEENDNIVHAAHGARYYWEVVGTPIDTARSEWQLAHTYIAVKRPVPAIYHGQKCLEVCHKHKLGAFSIAYAYEVLAHGAALVGDEKSRAKWLEAAGEFGETIEDDNDRQTLFNDLKKVPEI